MIYNTEDDKMKFAKVSSSTRKQRKWRDIKVGDQVYNGSDREKIFLVDSIVGRHTSLRRMNGKTWHQCCIWLIGTDQAQLTLVSPEKRICIEDIVCYCDNNTIRERMMLQEWPDIRHTPDPHGKYKFLLADPDIDSNSLIKTDN